jgi:hypothetical protein
MDGKRLKRILLSLPDAGLRLGWLESELARIGPREAATLLNCVAKESEASEPDAREALLSIVMCLADPEHGSLVEDMRREAAEQELFSLGRLVRRAPPPSILVPPPDGERIPDYGKGRELTLGERRSLARRPNRRAFEKLCHDPHPLVIRQLLENPLMVEGDAIRIATIRPARRETIQQLVRSARWMARPRVRLSILLNPGSPPEVAVPLVALCNREELRDVLRSTEISVILRGTAQELLARRPPMPEDTQRTIH